jgi:hypothetical protein
MCVPQRGRGLRELGPDLLQVQAEEIGKQMWVVPPLYPSYPRKDGFILIGLLGYRHIYGKARKSMIWLHSTSWAVESSVKALVSLQSPNGEEGGPAELEKHVEQVKFHLDAARTEEYWLCSGWTLQEGVLLHETDLIDGSGRTLVGADFWMSKQATVSDLTVPITKLAHELALGYFIKTQGYEPDMGAPSPLTAYLLSRMPALWLRQSLQVFLSSGLVGFWKRAPLDILSGKRGRTFRHDKDSCWALVGALGIEDIDITYDENVTMEEVKRRLLAALIDKYSWEMLSLPYPEFRLQDKVGPDTAERYFKWTDVADGVLLPVSIFAVEQQPQPDSSVQTLPTLSYTHDLRIKHDTDEEVTLYSASEDGKSWFRHYRQDENGLKIISPNDVIFDKDRLLSSAWLLPLHHINMKAGVLGRRCLLLVNLNHPNSVNEPARASFGGVLDIKEVGQRQVRVREIILNPNSNA